MLFFILLSPHQKGIASDEKNKIKKTFPQQPYVPQKELLPTNPRKKKSRLYENRTLNNRQMPRCHKKGESQRQEGCKVLTFAEVLALASSAGGLVINDEGLFVTPAPTLYGSHVPSTVPQTLPPTTVDDQKWDWFYWSLLLEIFVPSTANLWIRPKKDT